MEKKCEVCKNGLEQSLINEEKCLTIPPEPLLLTKVKKIEGTSTDKREVKITLIFDSDVTLNAEEVTFELTQDGSAFTDFENMKIAP
jgi:hypothetical protein